MFRFLRSLFGSTTAPVSVNREDEPDGPSERGSVLKWVGLEDQLAALADLGITLCEGISIDDIHYSFDREDYEKRPYDLLLFILGCEVERPPWGRPFCMRVWNFDSECIEGTDSYASIVRRLCEVAGAPDLLTDVEDMVDLDSGEAWLRYKIDGKERHWTAEVDDDWADGLVLSHVMDDIERDGMRFFAKGNGQSSTLFYLDDATAKSLNELSNNALEPVVVR